MLIQFVGATERVTGSCSWLKYKKTGIEFLVDCGMVQGEQNDQYENGKKFPFEPRNIKFVLLTHAHLDHCGLIPRLYKEGFKGKIICTRATAKLTKEILLDSAKKEDTTYDEKDVQRISFDSIDTREDFKWAKPMYIDQCLLIYFLRSAHILGAASIGVNWTTYNDEKDSILFTGDIGNNTEKNPFQSLLKYRQKPYETLQNIVIESTYGSKEHDPYEMSFEHRIEALEKHIIHTIVDNSGQLVIPTFSMHRTQEIMLDLYYIFAIKWKEVTPKCMQNIKNNMNHDQFINYSKHVEIENYSINELYDVQFDKDLYHDVCLEDKELLKTNNFTLHLDHEDTKRIIIDMVKINFSHKIKYILKEQYKKIKVLSGIPIKIYLDSNLGKKISTIYSEELCSCTFNAKEQIMKYPYRNSKLTEWFKMDDKTLDKVIHNLYAEPKSIAGLCTFEYKEKASNDRTGIFITSSGMCDKGPVLSHLSRVVNDSKNAILLTGYQSSGTNGDILSKLHTMSIAKKENTFITVEKNEKISCDKICASIQRIGGYSGHADKTSLLDYLFTNNDERQYTIPNIFINHGNNKDRKALKEAIEEKSKLLSSDINDNRFNTNVIIPMISSTFYDLENKIWIDEPLSEQAQILTKLQSIENSLKLILEKLDIA